MLAQIAAVVVPLFFIAAVGYIYGWRRQPVMGTANQLVINVFMPALVFAVMVQEDFSPLSYSSLLSAALLLMLVSGVLAAALARLLGYSVRLLVPPAMFSNWANLGLPLYLLALGDEALGAGVMLVVLGNILCFTLGIYIYSGGISLKNLLRTPILVAVAIGLLINALGIVVPSIVLDPIEMMGQVAIPLMLFSLGVRLTRVSWSEYKVGLLMSLFCPIVGLSLALLLGLIIPMSELHRNVLILFGVLPPAVINFMLAEHYDVEPERIASIVLMGNLSAILTVPIALSLVLDY